MSAGPLRQVLDDAIAESGLPMKDLTVLSPQVDPFRLDTPTNHINGRWLADAVQAVGRGEPGTTIHLRGLHYAIAMAEIAKPDGAVYRNNDEDWDWLQESVAKAARWLGYIPFDQIHDQRNSPPTRWTFTRPDPRRMLSVGLDIEVPDIEDINPTVKLEGFRGVQPWRIVMIGEKASLAEVLAPIAERRAADLYLPTGNISDTLVHMIARDAAEDGRPMVVLYFADCDPSGWNMPIEVGHKLRAFKASLYPGLEFRQYRTTLTPAQVREYGLPVTPLKRAKKDPSKYADKRAESWMAAMGVEQTEIDALATLRPDLLTQIAEDAIAPFYDKGLAGRVATVRQGWVREAQAIVDATVDQDALERLRTDAAAQLAEMQDEIDRINEAAQVDADDFDLPAIPAIPRPEVNGDQPLALLDSEWSPARHFRSLIESKRYGNGGAS